MISRNQAIAQILALLISAAVLAGCGPSYQFRGTVIDPPKPAPDFTLLDDQGQPFRLSEQHGKLVVLFFGFSSCPDICPTTLADLASVRHDLGNDAERMQVAMVTLDPQRDTQERLHTYVRRFDPAFVGLRGTEAELEAVKKAYGVTAIKRELPNSALNYTIDHSGFIYAIDPAGRWRAIFSPDTPVEDIASDVRQLMREG